MNFPTLGILPAALLVASVPSAYGQGTIVYHNPPDIPIFAEHVPYGLDVDQNGTVDFRLIKTGGDFTASAQGQNASLVVLPAPPNHGGYIVPLNFGELIGQSSTIPRTWYRDQIVETFPGDFLTVPGFFHACTTLWCIGTFYDVTAFWGVQFEIDGKLHYGWVRVATPDVPPGVFINGGTILDWAYNSIPGQPILAGQVPEPGTWALLSVGAGLLGWRTWRRRQRV